MQLEAGKQRITPLDHRETDERFETDFTARTNPHRGYLTIIEGCDKFCAYCVVPFTRGKERSRTADPFWQKPGKRPSVHRSPTSRAERNSYKYPSGKKTFAELLAAVGNPRHPPGKFHYVSSARFRRDIIEAIESVPSLCYHVHLPVQSASECSGCYAAPLYPRPVHGTRVVDEAAKREISITSDMIVGFPGEPEADFEQTLAAH